MGRLIILGEGVFIDYNECTAKSFGSPFVRAFLCSLGDTFRMSFSSPNYESFSSPFGLAFLCSFGDAFRISFSGSSIKSLGALSIMPSAFISVAPSAVAKL
jgi:hypothetical protein